MSAGPFGRLCWFSSAQDAKGSDSLALQSGTKRDFSGHIAKRATKVIGPISRHRIS